MSPRLVLAGIAALMTFGCSSDPHEQPAQLPPGSLPAVTVEAAPIQTEAPVPPDSPQALAGTTSAYVQSLRPQIESHVKPPAPVVSALPTAPPDPAVAEVKWLTPSGYQLTLGPPQRRDQAATPRAQQPEVPAATMPPDLFALPAANQVAEIADVSEPPVAMAPRAVLPSRRVTPVAAPTSDQLELKLAQQIKDFPDDLAAQVDYQLLQLLRERPVPQLDTLASLGSDDREIVSALMDALSNFRTNLRGQGTQLLTARIRPLTELADRLRSRSELRIPTITLCTRVDGFGVYEPIRSNRFLAGREHQVIVYCEVENFLSQSNDRRQWETALSQETVLYTASGQRAMTEKPRPVTDVSRNRRHDFFVVRMIKLPGTLPVGRYTLRVTITDQQANRVTEASTPLELVSDESGR